MTTAAPVVVTCKGANWNSCDAEIVADSIEEAILKGWTKVQESNWGPASWTHVGVCPDCRREASK